ncbi:MAG: BTAD domain-containing putative transcriptional regulator, partial [Bellilinea sp.]
TKVALDIGTLLQYLGKLANAEQIYQEVLSYYQTTGNVVWQANLLNNLGVLHFLVGDYEKALNELERSIQYAHLGGYQRLEAYALTSMGDLFRSLKLIHEAEEVYQKARDIDRQIDDQFLHFYLQYIEAELALIRKSIKKANNAITLASEIAKKAGSPYEIHLCELMQGRISFEEKKYPDALDQFSQAFTYFVDQGHHIEANRCRLMMMAASAGADRLDLTQTILDYLDTVVDNPEIHHLLMSDGGILASVIEQFDLPEAIRTRFLEVYDQVNEYERTLPGIRKMLRRQSQIVHISPPELTISTFGRIQIKLGDHGITSAEWMSQNARDLLLLLLTHPEGLTKEEIGEIFWPGSTPAELKLRFKNTIYRLRHAAGKDVVKFEGEIYTFNRGMDYEADYENFIQGLAAARRVENISLRTKSLRAVINIYRGTFLPELSDQWVITERERLHQMAMDAMIQLAELQLQQGELDGVLMTSQFLLDFEPTHEPMACLAMRALAASGNIAAVIQQYDQLRAALHEELDAAPSLQTIRLYENLTKEHRVVR